MTDTPLPPDALTKSHQYRLLSIPGGKKQWVLKPRFWRKKHRGACAGAFGGSR